METKRISSYKSAADKQFVENWNNKIQTLNNSFYEKLRLETSFGETVVFGFNHKRPELDSIVILPGARTFGMFWDLNDNLKSLKKNYLIYLVDVIGQPGLSPGKSPDVKTNEFGFWLKEILDPLNLDKTNIVGASFGGLLGMKLAKIAPEKISKLILLNPIGFSYISLAPKSLFFNLLPIFRPNLKNVNLFIDKIVLTGAEELQDERRDLLAEIILQTLQKFNFRADYPYKMDKSELSGWNVPTYIIVGEKDQLIPHRKTIEIARRTVENLKDIHILKNIGHGIELSKTAIESIDKILKVI
jgi:pimeloyl-ACP methyl ester carboxylesterase